MTPLDKQPEPPNTAALKREIGRRWSDVDLINILKEVDLRLNFTSAFRSSGSREALDAAQLRQRLLLCLFGLGTNIGLKLGETGGGDRECDGKGDNVSQNSLLI